MPVLRETVQLPEQTHPRCSPAESSLPGLRETNGKVISVGTHENTASGKRSAHQGKIHASNLKKSIFRE